MTKIRTIRAVASTTDQSSNGGNPAAGSPLDLPARTQRMSDDLAVLRRDLLVLSAGPQKEPTDPFGKPALLTAEAAAAYLMVSRTLIFALIKSRELDSVLIGSARRVPRVACDAYVAGLMDARRSA